MRISMCNVTSDRGNVIVIVAFLLTAMFSIAGFAIDSAMYMLKREELRTLAESVAVAAAHSLPNRDESFKSAMAWYERLRFDGNREIAPSTDAIEVTFNDNKPTDDGNVASLRTPYSVSSINVRIHTTYTPKIFPILKGAISVVGEVSAQLEPTDVVLVVENSASLMDVHDEILNVKNVKTANVSPNTIFERLFGVQKATIYEDQCFGDDYINFKKGVVYLYDLLSEIETFRVGVVLTNSKTNSPLVLAQLGQTTLKPEQLPFDKDEPDFHQTRCFAMTSQSAYHVPPNPNAIFDVPPPKNAGLLPLLKSPQSGDLSLLPGSTIRTREALWTLPAGHSTDSGYQHPQYYYSNTTNAVKLANDMLLGSRRTDAQKIASRVIIVLTDDAGVSPMQQSIPQTADSLCAAWHDTLTENNITLGVLYFGHTNKYVGHSFNKTLSDNRWIRSLRNDCGLNQSKPAKTFWGEISSSKSHTGIGNTETNDIAQRYNTSLTQYRDELIPLIAHGLRKVEILR